MTDLEDLRDKRAQLVEEAQRIVDGAKFQEREMNKDEKKRFDKLIEECEGVKRQIGLAEARDDMSKPAPRVVPPQPISYDPPGSPRTHRANGNGNGRGWMEWRNERGEGSVALRPEHRMADYAARRYPGLNVDDLSWGRAMRAIVTGSSDGLSDAEKRVMGETVNTLGGYMVPNVLSSRLIDLARNRSVLMRSGAITIPMESETISIATIVADPAVTAKAENASFTAVDFTIGQIKMTAVTVGFVVDSSVEVAQDTQNFVTEIEAKMSKRLAQQIDQWGLIGTGSGQPLGLQALTTHTETSVGSPTWLDFFTANEKVQSSNFEPNAMVMSANTSNSLNVLLINGEANHYAPTPTALQHLSRLITENVGDDQAFIGQFDQFVIGLRQQIRVDVTDTGGDRFNKYQVGFRVTWRGAFNVLDQGAFDAMSGIT